MSIKLTPEEIKALYAYIYGGSDTPEEYRLGAEIHNKVFGIVEKEIEARIAKVIKCADPKTGTLKSIISGVVNDTFVKEDDHD